jgi:hypothetical protein
MSTVRNKEVLSLLRGFYWVTFYAFEAYKLTLKSQAVVMAMIYYKEPPFKNGRLGIQTNSFFLRQ